MKAMAPKDGSVKSINSVKSVNALLDLLSVVGLDTLDNSLIDREFDKCSIELRNSRDSAPEDPQPWDRQVEKLVRQLKDVLRDAPERDAEYSYIGGSRGPSDREMHDPNVDELPPPRVGPDIDPDPDDRRQYLEREFSSTSYPKIGPGYSDSISVVSDLTTPTCMPGQHVEEDEHYGSLPLQIDFSRRAPKPQLRRPSLEDKGPSPVQRDRRVTTIDLRPPSRRELTKPGGAAATRRQNHQMTMAHLEASIGSSEPYSPSSSRASDSRGVPKSVNDFPSLIGSSRSPSDDTVQSGSRRESGRRSLLRKSNKYAAAVSAATASQRMLLARQDSAKHRKRVSRRSSTGDTNPVTRTGIRYVEKVADEFPGFSAVEENDVKAPGDPVLIDEDGFIIGAAGTQDPFANSSFGNDFPKDGFGGNDSFTPATNSFFPAPAKDTKKKKGGSNRRASTGTTGVGKTPKKRIPN